MMFWNRPKVTTINVTVSEAVSVEPGQVLMLFIDHPILDTKVGAEIKARFPENEVHVFGRDWRVLVVPAPGT